MILSRLIFLFDNYKDNKIDIALINETGQIEIAREVEVSTPWGEFAINQSNSVRITRITRQEQII